MADKDSQVSVDLNALEISTKLPKDLIEKLAEAEARKERDGKVLAALLGILGFIAILLRATGYLQLDVESPSGSRMEIVTDIAGVALIVAAVAVVWITRATIKIG